jgi:hypothetical protein
VDFDRKELTRSGSATDTCAPAMISMLTALNLELPVVWDSSAADREGVQGTVWVPVAVQVLAPAPVGAARCS